MTKWISRIFGTAAILIGLFVSASVALWLIVLIWVVLGPQQSHFDTRVGWLVNLSVWVIVGLLAIGAAFAIWQLFRSTAGEKDED